MESALSTSTIQTYVIIFLPGEMEVYSSNSGGRWRDSGLPWAILFSLMIQKMATTKVSLEVTAHSLKNFKTIYFLLCKTNFIEHFRVTIFFCFRLIMKASS